MNIEVKILNQAGNIASSDGNDLFPNKTEGATPRRLSENRNRSEGKPFESDFSFIKGE